jgi:hypothetical protein
VDPPKLHYDVDVFEGLFSPWHLFIIAVATFIVVGPRALLRRWHALSETVQHWTDGEEHRPEQGNGSGVPATGTHQRRSLAYRVGSRLRRRRG